MSESSNWLVHDHRKFDTLLEQCELAAEAGEWKAAIKLFYEFTDALKLHMRMEDEVLYPLIVEETGDPDGAIAMLGREHDDIVRLLHDLDTVIRTRDDDAFGESLEPLHNIMREHDDHEEQVFRHLGSDSILMQRDEIIGRLHALKPGSERSWGF
jgi:hypothetical protein